MLKRLHCLLIVLLLCCTTIANLPEEPKPPIIPTLKSLAKYETQLSEYVMYLVTFLAKTKVKVNDPQLSRISLSRLINTKRRTLYTCGKT